MDHSDAMRLQAAEKYVLGDLPAALRDEYEDHYFGCSECAAELQATIAFVESTKEALRGGPEKEMVGRNSVVTQGWFAWLTPKVAVPVFAVMLLLLSYQTFVRVPFWKAQAGQSASPRVLAMYSLISANSRGSGLPVFQAHRSERIGLYVDVPADSAYQAYILRLEDPNGLSTILRSLTLEEAKRTQVVELDPATVQGEYQLVVLGLAKQESEMASAVTLSKMQFAIALNP
jgi:hypothetical protein